eukprot:CAMPEP_0194168656 /NCGR_PEP_ID=MMETSP0154-20130528/3535_1 /TAXON_ID=1049557 /ORGANISM="Thalassiothrix antarctica, Strain L6-D1" /LENGTH=669 /DNA_ID=CAMNT_0038879835 /DNA_START=82 /DNA_END=2088 /DNA_ORIENTATION=+
MDEQSIPFLLVVATGTTTVILGSALAYVLMQKHRRVQEPEEISIKSGEIDCDKYPGGRVSVYYATQTGTAETFARQLEDEGSDHGFLIDVVDLEDVEVVDLTSKDRCDGDRAKAIFLTSTYGEGEAPDNANIFVTEMESKLAIENGVEEEKKESDILAISEDLKNLDYCVFGLGNTQYEHFNAMGKIFDSKLEKLGGNRIAPLGIGNDDDDIEADFESWKDEVLWPTLEKNYLKEGLKVTSNKTNRDFPETPYHVEFLSGATKPKSFVDSGIHSSGKHYFSAIECSVTVNRELRSSLDPGSTKHIEIDVSRAKDFSYATADNLGVLPVNRMEDVESIAKSLDYNLDAVFTLSGSQNHEWHGAPFPIPISIKELLLCYCDLTSAPRRSELKLLACYATDPIDKSALSRMSSKEGKAEYRKKIIDSHIGLVNILKMCPSIEAPLEHFLTFCPRLLPRFYTISSSSSLHPKSVHLTVSVTETMKKDGSIYKGICSGHLAKASSVRIFNRESAFRLPKESSNPIIMIGPGTGVAPMRALIQEREYQRKTLKKEVGANILYFGCKRANMDYLYEDEFKKMKKSGLINEIYVAFSRETSKKVYVQHLLEKNAGETWNLIGKQNAYIYVCGGVRMGSDVRETLRRICVSKGNLSTDAADEFMRSLADNGRYVQELW